MLWHFSFNETRLKIIPINKYKHIDEIVVNNTVMYVTSIIFMILWSDLPEDCQDCPPSTLAEIFQRTCLGGWNCLTVFLINFLAKSENSKHFSFFSKKNLKILGGGKIFKMFFWSIFSPNQAILSAFRFFHFFQKEN